MLLQENFGGNQKWISERYRPASEAEVLEILRRHRRGHVRAAGARHSWSGIAASADATLDLSLLETVEPRGDEVRVGAGCPLQSLLERLHAATDRTLPTMGVIKRQSIAGAIATGTHGSGMPALSHFVTRVRVAAYDPASGEPRIFDYTAGEELRASRCGLGCTGVLLSVDVRTVPKYRIEERVVLEKGDLGAVLARCSGNPLTQFSLIPYRWVYLVFERRVTQDGPRLARFFRAFNAVWVDRAVHASLWLAVRLGDASAKMAVKLAPFLVAPWILVRGRRRRDDAEHVLTMRHDLFRHEEMELFVPESRLAEALDIVRCATEVFAGAEPLPGMKARLGDFFPELSRSRGSFTLHYPLSIRRVLPEDTLISMASGGREAYFSISVFTYHPPHRREPYYAFCRWLARCLTSLVDARPHWGKLFPVDAAEITRLYPELPAFKRLCARTDPARVFQNAFTERVLGG